MTNLEEKISGLLKNYLHEQQYNDVVTGQLLHRVNIVSRWNITPGSKILEIGCGQGDCTGESKSQKDCSGKKRKID
jgi:hypothetical protein